MPNTYGGTISQEISRGLGNVSAIYGLQNQMRQSQREDELYNIRMKEYQKGLEPADWGKIGNFLDAGEEGLGYAKAYAGALGKDPDKMTRSDMREFGEIFLKDQKAAHDILQFRRRHYGQKAKEYEGKPGLESEYGMFKEKFDQATMLDKTYREAQSFRQEQEQIQKATQAMQKVASMSDEELSLKGYPPIMRDMAASGDIQGFRSIAGKIAEAQVKPPSDFERYKNMTPAERKEYGEFKGAGKSATDKLTPKGFDQKGRAVYAGPEGNLVYEDKTPYKGGQLKGITEPWAPIPPEWEKKEQLNTVRNEIKDVTGQIDAVRKQMTWGLAENGPAEILRLEKLLKDLKAEESRLTGKKETPKTETAIPKQESTNVIRYDTKGNRITK